MQENSRPKILISISFSKYSLFYLVLFLLATKFQCQHTLKWFKQSLVEPEMRQLVTIDKKLTKNIMQASDWQLSYVSFSVAGRLIKTNSLLLWR